MFPDPEGNVSPRPAPLLGLAAKNRPSLASTGQCLLHTACSQVGLHQIWEGKLGSAETCQEALLLRN